jgi:hypothetical protein
MQGTTRRRRCVKCRSSVAGLPESGVCLSCEVQAKLPGLAVVPRADAPVKVLWELPR